MRLACAILFALLSPLLLSVAPVARAQTSEELVKATFLYRFVSFVTWPPEAFATPEAPIRLCVIGSAPLAGALRDVVANAHVEGRSFEVRRPADPSSAVQCHAVYVAGDRSEETLRIVRGRPVLTITDGTIGDDTRGIIHFVQIDRRVRFHIDDARAAEGGLFMNSRLLALGVSVRRRPAS